MSTVISYCHLRNNKILKDGKVVFENKKTSFDSFIEEVYSSLGVDYPKFYKMDRLSKIGFIAAEILLRDSRKTSADLMAIVLSNSNASLDTDIRYWETTKVQASPSLFVYTLPNIVAGEISIRHGIKGESTFFISERFDPIQTANYVDLLLREGLAQNCIAGWVDILGNDAEVFLYLAAKSNEESASKISELYHTWNN